MNNNNKQKQNGKIEKMLGIGFGSISIVISLIYLISLLNSKNIKLSDYEIAKRRYKEAFDKILKKSPNIDKKRMEKFLNKMSKKFTGNKSEFLDENKIYKILREEMVEKAEKQISNILGKIIGIFSK